MGTLIDASVAIAIERQGLDPRQLLAWGKPVGNHDLIVAATAIARDWEVATHDVRSFPRIPGLRLARW